MSWLIFIAIVALLGYVVYRKVRNKVEIIAAMGRVLYLHKHYVATPELMRTRIIEIPVVNSLYDRDLVRQVFRGLRVDVTTVKLVSQRYNDLEVTLADPVLKMETLMRTAELKLSPEQLTTLTHFRLIRELKYIDAILSKHDLARYLR